MPTNGAMSPLTWTTTRCRNHQTPSAPIPGTIRWTGVAPPERWSAGMRYGVTADEQADGESLDQLLAEEEPDDTANLTEDALADDEDDEDDDDLAGFEDLEDEDEDEDEDAGDEDVDGLLLDDGPDPRACGWWPRTRAPIPTRRRTWSPTTPGSPAARRPPRKRPCTSSRKTTTTSARSNGPRRTGTSRARYSERPATPKDPRDEPQHPHRRDGDRGRRGLAVPRLGHGLDAAHVAPPVPPYTAASVLMISRQWPATGRPTR